MGGKAWGMVAGLALAALSAAALGARAEPVRAHIDSGALVGDATGAVAVFKGVPYVAAPVGPLRWAPPATAPAWRGERASLAYGSICPQKVNANGAPNEGGAFGPTSENCLFLNVWAPRAGVGHPGAAPVMVWLHGGSNAFGAGSLGVYEGGAFVRDGVILVTVNYRLGALGFFAHPALTAAAKRGEPLANYGIMDQIAALKWVRRNIAAFGGDPAKVTVFGESAGGSDVLTLMASPLARGLFQRAIVESGGGWSPPVTLAAREVRGEALAVKAGAPAHATAAQLRALPVDALVGAGGDDFGEAIDGRLLTQSPAQAFADGQVAKVPLLIGSNSYEASLMATLKLTPAQVLAFLPAAPRAAYADVNDEKALASAMFTDSFMGGPARWIAGQASGGPSYLYHFSYVPSAARPFLPGAGHASEIPFVFDTWDKLGVMAMGVKLTAADQAVADAMHGCWVAFARTGVPSCSGGPAWPSYNRARDTLMEFNGAPPVLVTHFRQRQLDAQEAAALPKLELKK